MKHDELKQYDGDFVVIETDDDHYVGTIEVGQDTVTVKTGYTGKPPVIDHDDIESVVAADSHPLVVPA